MYQDKSDRELREIREWLETIRLPEILAEYESRKAEETWVNRGASAKHLSASIARWEKALSDCQRRIDLNVENSLRVMDEVERNLATSGC